MRRLIVNIVKLVVYVPVAMWMAMMKGLEDRNGHIHLRRIRIGVLGVSGIVYRVHIVIIQSCFWYVFYGFARDMWEWKWAISSSLLWNLFNTALYYNYHYWFARFFRIGREA